MKSLLRRLVTLRRPSGKQPSLRIHFQKPTEPPPRWQGQDFLRAEPSRTRPWGGPGRWRAGGAGRRDVGTLSCQLPTPLGDTARARLGSQDCPVSFLNTPKTTSNPLAHDRSHPMAFFLLRPGPCVRAQLSMLLKDLALAKMGTPQGWLSRLAPPPTPLPPFFQSHQVQLVALWV